MMITAALALPGRQHVLVGRPAERSELALGLWRHAPSNPQAPRSPLQLQAPGKARQPLRSSYTIHGAGDNRRTALGPPDPVPLAPTWARGVPVCCWAASISTALARKRARLKRWLTSAFPAADALPINSNSRSHDPFQVGCRPDQDHIQWTARDPINGMHDVRNLS